MLSIILASKCVCVYSSEYILYALTIIHRSLSSDQKIYFQIFEGRKHINHCIELRHKGGSRQNRWHRHRERWLSQRRWKKRMRQVSKESFFAIGLTTWVLLLLPLLPLGSKWKTHFYYFWRISLIFAAYSEIIDQIVEHAVERHVAFQV